MIVKPIFNNVKRDMKRNKYTENHKQSREITFNYREESWNRVAYRLNAQFEMSLLQQQSCQNNANFTNLRKQILNLNYILPCKIFFF